MLTSYKQEETTNCMTSNYDVIPGSIMYNNGIVVLQSFYAGNEFDLFLYLCNNIRVITGLNKMKSTEKVRHLVT